MPFLDDIAEILTPSGGGVEGRTYTAAAPILPKKPTLPQLEGVDLPSLDELHKEWARQDEEKAKSAPRSQAPGSLLQSLISIKPSQKLTDIMGNYADNLRRPAFDLSKIKTKAELLQERENFIQSKETEARNANPSASAQAQALGYSPLSDQPESDEERLAKAQTAIDMSAPQGRDLAEEEMQHPESYITGAIRKAIGGTAVGKKVFGVIDPATNPFGIRAMGAREEAVDDPGLMTRMLGGAAKTLGELKIAGVVNKVLGIAPNAENLFTTHSVINEAPNIAENPLDPKPYARIGLSRLTGKAYGPAEEAVASTIAEKELSPKIEPLIQGAGKVGTSAAIMASQPVASHVIEGGMPKPEEIGEGAASGVGFGLMGAKNKNAPNAGDNVNRMIEAIIGQESGGDPNAVSSTGVKGKYQITEANTKAWTKKFLGKEIPRDELIGTPEEDIVGQSQIREYYEKNLEKYGDPRKAARETAKDWYGRGEHSTGPSPNLYAKQVIGRFDKATGESIAQSEPTSDIPAPEPEETPQPEAEQQMRAEVNAKAHEAATSPENDLPEPTPLQKQSGNYKKGHVAVAGFDISVENPAGSVRKGIASDGTPWETEMQDHYGYIKGSTGADGDHLDAFIGPDPTSQKVFVVDQINSEDENRPFDEHKVVLGATGADEAKEIYKRNFSDDAEPRIGAITETTPQELKTWIDEGNPREPFAESDVAKAADSRQPTAGSEEPATQVHEKIIITREDEVNLRNLGYTQAEINAMRPREAGKILSTNENATTSREQPAGDLAEYPDRGSGGETARPGDSDRTSYGTAESPSSPLGGEEGTPAAPGEAQSPAPARPAQLYGRETSVITADGKIPARYAVREAADIQTSHDPVNNFKENPEWNIAGGEVKNTRDYTQPAEQGKVYAIAQKLNPEEIANTSPGVTEGTPITDTNGIAAGGNGRSMGLKLAYVRGEGDAYKDHLVKEAATFGLDPQEIEGMKRPVLVREMTGIDLPGMAKPEGMRLVDDLNKSPSQSLDPISEALKNSQRFDSSQADAIISAIGEHETINDAVRRPAISRQIVGIMERAGVIDARTRPSLVTDGKLNDKGADLLQDMLLAKVMPDEETLRQIPKSLKNRITKAVPSLLAVEHSSIPDLSLKADLKAAIEYKMQSDDFVRDKKGTAEDYRNQGDAFATPLSKTQEHLVDLLSLEGKGSERAFREALSDYARQAKQFITGANQDAMFAEANVRATPEEIMARAAKTAQRMTGLAGAGTLHSEILPVSAIGKAFGELGRQDIKPKIINAGRAVSSVKDGILKLLAPQSRSDAARDAGILLNHETSEKVQEHDRAVNALAASERLFDTMPEADQIEFQRRIWNGQQQETPELQQIADTYRATLDEYAIDVHNAGKLLGKKVLENPIENYFPGIFVDASNNQKNIIQGLFAKRPMEGSAFFLKQRSGLDFDQHLDIGLWPKETNPARQLLLYKDAIDQYITAHKTTRDLLENDLSKVIPVKKGKPIEKEPEGWVPIPDKIGMVKKMTEEGEVVSARIYAPPEVAQIISNYLSEGFGKYSIYRGMRKLGNTANMVALGISGVHATLTGINDVATGLSRAISQATKGNIAEATKQFSHGVSDEYGNFSRLIPGIEHNDLSSLMQKEWLEPGSQAPEIQKYVKWMKLAGGVSQMDPHYSERFTNNMIRAWRQNNPLGALGRLPASVIEQFARPTMQILVPTAKRLAFAKSAELAMHGKPENISDLEAGRILGKVWKDVDDTFGQYTYKNLILHNKVKDAMFILIGRPGWNLGTVSKFSGGMYDIFTKTLGLQMPRSEGMWQNPIKTEGNSPEFNREFTERSAFTTMALPFVVGTFNGMIQIALGQGPPQDWKDLFLGARDGTFGADGSPNRVSPVNYVKDMFSYVTDFIGTVTSKLQPVLTTEEYLRTGKDYHGERIYSKEGNLLEHIGEGVKFAAAQLLEPYSVKGAIKQIERGASAPEVAASFMGIMPVSKRLTESAAGKLMDEYSAESISSSGYEVTPRSKLRNEIIRTMRSDKSKGLQLLKSDVGKGLLSRDDITKIRKESSITDLQSKFKSKLSFDQAMEVYKVATPQQRGQLRTELFGKFRNKRVSSMNAEERKTMREKFISVKDLPYTSPLNK